MNDDVEAKIWRLGYALLKEHGLDGWEIRYLNSKRLYGQCNYREKRIQISKVHLRSADYEEVKDTLLHEIAHALTKGDGHGKKWKAMCVKLGCRPNRLAPEKTTDDNYKYIAYCEKCKKPVGGWYIKPRCLDRGYTHKECGGGNIQVQKTDSK